MPATNRTGRESETPYLDAWQGLWNNGWKPFPIKGKGSKGPPPSGITGEFGISPSYADCLDWADNGGRQITAGNVGIRLPKGDDNNYGVIALDVDHYQKGNVFKYGADSIAQYEKEWGALPDTWRTSARGAANPSGARLFRVAAGTKISTEKLQHVDAIHYGYRYIISAPSYNPDSRTTYKWISPQGVEGLAAPSVDDLPLLPEEWVVGLSQKAQATAKAVTHVASVKVDGFFESLPQGEPCTTMANLVTEISEQLQEGNEARHDIVLQGTIRLMRLGEQKHKGAMTALQLIADRYVATVSGDGTRTIKEAEAEFQRMVIAEDGTSKAVSYILANPTPADRKGCSCLTPKQQKQREQQQQLKAEKEAEELQREKETREEVQAKIAAKDSYDQFEDEFEHVSFRAGIQNNYPLLADSIKKELPVEVDRARILWHYQGGQYTKEGTESWVRLVADRLLGESTNLEHKANVVDILKSKRPRITQEDVDPRYINVKNGMLEWKTGKLIDHSPSFYSIGQIHAGWNPDAECPVFEKFLSEVVPTDAIDLAYEIIGYSLLNDLPIHKAVMLSGGGRNGKGTFINVLTALIGDENLAHVAPQKLDSNRFDRATLFGKVANLVGDVSSDSFYETGNFKSLTGGDVISAENKGKDLFHFKNRATMIFGLNTFPQSFDTSSGFLSRWIVLPFPNSFFGREDTTLLSRMTTKAELEGILVKAIAGLQRLMERGRFEVPISVQIATSNFKDVASPVRDFTTEQVFRTEEAGERGGKMFLDKRDIYQRYKHWCKANGYERTMLGKIQFNNEFRSVAPEVLGLDKLEDLKRNGQPGYAGLKLNTEIRFADVD